jgi:hypothetical protein
VFGTLCNKWTEKEHFFFFASASESWQYPMKRGNYMVMEIKNGHFASLEGRMLQISLKN